MLERLEAADGDAELVAGLGVVDAELERAAGQADERGAGEEPPVVERAGERGAGVGAGGEGGGRVGDGPGGHRPGVEGRGHRVAPAGAGEDEALAVEGDQRVGDRAGGDERRDAVDRGADGEGDEPVGSGRGTVEPVEQPGRDEALDDRDRRDGAAVLLRDDRQLGGRGAVERESGQAERAGLRPQVGVESGRAARLGGPDSLGRRFAGEEAAERVAQRLGVVAHPGSVVSSGCTSRDSVAEKSMYSRLSVRTTATLSGPA